MFCVDKLGNWKRKRVTCVVGVDNPENTESGQGLHVYLARIILKTRNGLHVYALLSVALLALPSLKTSR